MTAMTMMDTACTDTHHATCGEPPFPHKKPPRKAIQEKRAGVKGGAKPRFGLGAQN